MTQTGTKAVDPWAETFGAWDGTNPATALRPLVLAAEELDPLRWKNEPARWTEEIMDGFIWSKQIEIKESVRDNRYTAVPSCHDAGKSFSAADAILWWTSAHPIEEVFVVWTAPTYPQVNAIIGREIRQMLRSRPELGLRLLGDNTLVTRVGKDEEAILVGYGRKPSDYNPAAFQGIHAKYVLVVVDEACGVPESLWNAVDSIVTSEHSAVLAIGNPDDPNSHFAKICKPGSKIGDGWNIIHIDGYETPNFTGEEVPARLRDLLLSVAWVEERKRRWGEESALFQAKVRGRFVESSEDSVIPYAIARACLGLFADEDSGWTAIGPGVLGCDIARGGGDENTIISLHNGRAQVVARFHEPDLMKTVARIEAELESRGPRWKAVVDGDGLGGGVIDRLRQMRLPVVEYRGSAKAQHRPSRFKNRRAEAWWGLRLLLQDAAIGLPSGDDDADTLLRDLTVPRIIRDAAGRIQVEPKDEIRKRLGASPDLGDALVMAASEAPSRVKRFTKRELTETHGEPRETMITAGLLTEAM